MKKLASVALIMILNTLSIQVINAQGALMRGLKDKAQQKIEQRIENRVNQKIDNEIDKQLDKAEEAIFKDEKNDSTINESRTQSNKNDERLARMFGKIGITGEPVPVADSYSFDQLIQMHLESFDINGKKISEGEFITLLSRNEKNMAYQSVSGNISKQSQGIFIIDTENNAFLVLNDDGGKKTGLVYGLGAFVDATGESYNYDSATFEDTPEYYAAHPNIKKTGKTKTIAGYSCEQYLLSDEYSEGEVWVTRDIKMKTNDFFSTVFKIEMAAVGMGWGYLMESVSVKKDTGEKSTMKVTKVDPNASRKFILSDYQITNIGSLAPKGEKQ